MASLPDTLVSIRVTVPNQSPDMSDLLMPEVSIRHHPQLYVAAGTAAAKLRKVNIEISFLLLLYSLTSGGERYGGALWTLSTNSSAP